MKKSAELISLLLLFSYLLNAQDINIPDWAWKSPLSKVYPTGEYYNLPLARDNVDYQNPNTTTRLVNENGQSFIIPPNVRPYPHTATQSEVETAKDDYNITNESHKTMTHIKRIMTGDADKEMYDPTMEYVLNTTAQKVGEMEHFMEIAQQFTEKSDLENGLYEEEALKMLEEWEKRGDSVLLGTEKAQLIRIGLF